MKGNLKSLIPTEQEFLEMAVAELASILLFDTIRHEERVFPSSLVQYVGMHFRSDDAADASVEALGWLIAEGILVPDYNPGAAGGYRLTREARKAVDQADIDELIKARQVLPKHLHPLIIQKAVPTFRSGSYDMAVAAAFKEVEVLVRDATNLAGLVGVPLMNKAFSPTGGLLCDTNLDSGEQVGTMALFAGAMGIFRNPAAHRNVNTTSQQAAQLLVFASILIETAEGLIAEAKQAGRIT
jgi:uncharacterized protein (TIGR02391 family)